MQVLPGRLVWKIRSRGIQGELANWIQNRLVGKSQRMVVEGSVSHWSPVTSGAGATVCHLY